jgi:hypothetical protein
MSEEFRNEDTGSSDPVPPIRPAPPSTHWFVKALMVMGAIAGIGVLGVVVLAGLVLATCALGGR